ncbi:hypothetical protein BGW80DRAFT_1561503 [Lactifluus volemus]|nr:hypothetical protein BGW80DRAFT_1561503 [Lactifluus volemus]
MLCEHAGRPIDPCPSAIARRLVNGCGRTLLHRRSLPLMTVEIVLLYDDFVLGRSIVPPHAGALGPPCGPQHQNLCRWGGEGSIGYVDALGEPIDPARFDNGIVIWSSEVWGVDAARVARALH